MEFFYVVKATQKSGKKDAVIWFTAKTEARANLQLDVELEDADIETGRGKDYMKPVRTDFPVFNDLPEENTVDLTWCERYELADDQRTWQLKPGAAPQDAFHQEDVADNDLTTTLTAEDNGDRKVEYSDDENAEFQLVTMPFRIQLLAQLCAEDGHVYHISIPHRKELSALEMDVDNSYVQNLLLAIENVQEVKTHDMPTLWKLTDAIKKIFPQDKRCELNAFIQFAKAWAATEYIDRVLLVKEWLKGNRVAKIQRTDTGTNAGGGNKTDRPADYVHTLDSLDIEIALATLPMDFNIYEIPGGIYRRAKEIVSKKESPFIEWSKALRKCAGILDYSRAAIFALIRGAEENTHHFPELLSRYINRSLTESNHAAPAEETLAAAGHAPDISWENEISEQVATEQQTQPEISNMGNGVFSIDGLMNAPAKQTEETTSNEPMEKTEHVESEVNDAVSAGESVDEAGAQADTVTETVCTGCGALGGGHCPDCGAVVGDATYAAMEADLKEELEGLDPKVSNAEILAAAAPTLANEIAQEVSPDVLAENVNAPEEPATEYPAFFEPGRYEGLPNEVYHAANGISSTQVKDARVSLMYYHARHITRTIRRDSSDALTFGSLAHTMALEPEKLDEEFAIFPGVPAEAFTTTDSLKAFIREYNADKPKAEQLKLTGKKEDLQEAIRTVSPDAIFADEFEQQWRESVAGKTILTTEQLGLATAIQQALFNNHDVQSLLGNPDRQSEVSYFGIDEETGLEIRVRPDIELRTPTENTCADLKTVTIGNVRQDRIKERLHREIIDRDYHLSAAMYCDVAGLDSFSWIFVNKEPGYHWVAVVQASEAELELGRQEYRRVLRQINEAMENDTWPAPIIGSYTDELNDYDMRRLQALVEE